MLVSYDRVVLSEDVSFAEEFESYNIRRVGGSEVE